jgi:ABC-type branched-subunit amino acid transport system ATPase component
MAAASSDYRDNAGAFTRGHDRAGIAQDLDKIYEYFPRLRERRRTLAGYTSGGEQQMTVIGRAMMARPRMILLDEPSMGLAPQLVEVAAANGARLTNDVTPWSIWNAPPGGSRARNA